MGKKGNSQPLYNDIKSNLSFSYIHAVASRLGGSCQPTDKTADNMGVDARLTFQGDFSAKSIIKPNRT